MKWLNRNIEIDTKSIIISVAVFSILSLLCCIFTIYTYLRMKQKTIIYHFFFHFSINEILSRLTFISRLIFENNATFFRIISFIIYFTDTNIVILIAFICFGMYQLILKQNTKLENRFHIISIFLYIFSLIITIVFFILSHYDIKDGKEIDLYRNIICLVFITDKDEAHLEPLLLSTIVYIGLLIFSIIFIILIQIFIKDRSDTSKKDKSESVEEDDKRIKSSLKLKSFKTKLLVYPGLTTLHCLFLFAYSWLEYSYLKHKDDLADNIGYLRARYALFNIYCIFIAIRGILLFLIFTMNEKIKRNLFKKVLFCEIFKTIDKIKKEEEYKEGSSSAIESLNQPVEKEMSFNDDSSEEYILKKIKKKNKIDEDEDEEKDKDEEENKLIEMDINPKEGSDKMRLMKDDDEEDECSEEDEDDDEEKKDEKNDKSEKIKS